MILNNFKLNKKCLHKHKTKLMVTLSLWLIDYKSGLNKWKTNLKVSPTLKTKSRLYIKRLGLLKKLYSNFMDKFRDKVR